MNLKNAWSMPRKVLFQWKLLLRNLTPRVKSKAFGRSQTIEEQRIGRIYVMNLDRQADRWNLMKKELDRVLDFSGDSILKITERYSAVDARSFGKDFHTEDVNATYTLADQLFVEPQPDAIPTQFDLDAPIRMSRPEIAISCSHINIWRKVAIATDDFALVLEDDVWFKANFAQYVDKVWDELKDRNKPSGCFDILYLSYQEVKYGAPKTLISENIFKPVRGLWQLSGYVISRPGAKKLLTLLPSRGPIDLWINFQFKFIDVLASRRSIIEQRTDLISVNSYSILPALTKIGAIDSEASALFHSVPIQGPVFAFGPRESGLTSLAVALSMLGYRCCHDLDMLPEIESKKIFSANHDRVFDAYVNIGSLESAVSTLAKLYPKAKFIFLRNNDKEDVQNDLKSIGSIARENVAVLGRHEKYDWKAICQLLNCAPPICSFPKVTELGKRTLIMGEQSNLALARITKRDKSPWAVSDNKLWDGIYFAADTEQLLSGSISTGYTDDFLKIDSKFWIVRDDTFTGNMALFRPVSVELLPAAGLALRVARASLSVRNFSAGSLSSHHHYLYGTFEAVIKASNAPGIVTGFFLHRDSPRQEIDIEITGNKPNRLLVNVFYNPGDEGANFDYGYRGSPSFIDLGFDASESYHKYKIVWKPNEILWFVDDRLVHRRVEWNPTPIPTQPMRLHINTWPTRSVELAGNLKPHKLPTRSFFKSLALQANQRLSPVEAYEHSVL